ncbi:gamma-glutamylcyclotransferase [Mycobacterium sp. KBS0706]|uniref:gamma-glutamylcyclotransferase n=1 Tax=Mycobacterium sp. KBS0706 TaxID=2578109 RepID=UPI00110FA04C|nr:gamma-glutamylcyclotransferase [Mycobacterium sp. KBS0706]TSD84153.1 gamma-glutamylcyclotransferase [Mycobacterium sp. KBS0706]
MTKKKKKSPGEEQLTFLPDQPLPPEALEKYTLNHDPHEEAEIARYVNIECHGDETVQYVELIKTEYVVGQRYDAWDVHTDKQRWWVLTNLTNLYPQNHFPSLDYTLSFHIGLMQRMIARQQREAGGRKPDPFDEVYRRRDEIGDLIIEAIEAEEFQSAGMRLRECLITLVGAVRRRIELPAGGEFPRDADVPGWNEILINHLCRGGSNKTLRQYLKTTSDRTWQLVNWLTHDRDANMTEAIIAHEAVGVQIGHFVQLAIRDLVDLVVQCPKCSSRDVRSYYDPAIAPDGDYYQRCKACDWDDHPGHPNANGDEVGT